MLRFEGSFSFSFIKGKTSINFQWTDSDGEEFDEEVDLAKPLEVRGNVVHLPRPGPSTRTNELEIYLPLGRTKTLEELCA